MTEAADRPTIRLLAGHAKRLRAGHPWIFSNEIAMDAAAKALEPGTLARVIDAGGEALVCATFNPHSLIAARVVDRDPEAPLDAGAIARRLTRARDLRDRLIGAPFYRLIHAEADRLPGLVVDRFGDVLVVQANTAGAERLLPVIAEALDATLKPRGIVYRCDSAVRRLEGLDGYVRTSGATPDAPVAVPEGGVTFRADLIAGQKTGWYFDQRDNRAFVAALASGARVLDLYCHGGGFGLRALAAGAAAATLVDTSQPALDLARAAAEASGLTTASFARADVFAYLESRGAAREVWDVVITDPPSFVKSRKDLGAGLRGYRKLARLAAAVVAPGGILAIASCSHNVDAPTFDEQVRRGLGDAGREARILRASGAAPDHPLHPALPESAYLKCLVLQVD